MNADDALLPVVLPADAGAARPLRRAFGLFLVAAGLPLAAYMLAAIGGAATPAYAAGVIGIPAIAIAIIAGFHVLAGLMVWLGEPRARRRQGRA